MDDWLVDPVEIASDILSRISTYDSTAPAPSDPVLFQWAEMIERAHIEHRFLAEGVIRVYAGGGDPPKNKLGSVIAEAKEARKIAGQGRAIAELGPSFSDEAHGPTGYAIDSAYRHDGVVHLPCSTCGVPAGEYCEKGGEIKKIPCSSRLAQAYRENNPEGRRRHQERQAHLAEHRRTFKPSWVG